MDLTTIQLASLCQVSERTVQRWIRTGKLNVQALPNGRYRVSEADIDAVRPPDVVTLVERIEALETDVRGLHEALQRLEGLLETHLASHTPPARILRPGPAEYKVAPGGLVTARSFAERHKVSKERMATLIAHQAFETTTVPYQNSVQHQLTADQQRAVILYWQEHGVPFTACPECPHEQQAE